MCDLSSHISNLWCKWLIFVKTFVQKQRQNYYVSISNVGIFTSFTCNCKCKHCNLAFYKHNPLKPNKSEPHSHLWPGVLESIIGPGVCVGWMALLSPLSIRGALAKFWPSVSSCIQNKTVFFFSSECIQLSCNAAPVAAWKHSLASRVSDEAPDSRHLACNGGERTSRWKLISKATIWWILVTLYNSIMPQDSLKWILHSIFCNKYCIFCLNILSLKQSFIFFPLLCLVESSGKREYAWCPKQLLASTAS